MNDRTNEVCRFDRNFYLEFSRDFETGKWEDGYFERKEFSDDIEAMALELAYTRYLLAKAENILREVQGAKLMNCCDYCDETLVRRPDETAGNFRNRKTCNKKCASFLREARKGR
jgi:hypothetical protein